MTLANPLTGYVPPGMLQPGLQPASPVGGWQGQFGMFPTLPGSAFDPATGQLTGDFATQYGTHNVGIGADIPNVAGGATIIPNSGTQTGFSMGMTGPNNGWQNVDYQLVNGQYVPVPTSAASGTAGGNWADDLIKYGAMAGAGIASGGAALGYGSAGPGAEAIGGSGAMASGAGASAFGSAAPLTYGSVPGSFGGAAGAPVAGDVGAGMGGALPGAAGGAGAGTGADLSLYGYGAGAGAGAAPLDALGAGGAGMSGAALGGSAGAGAGAGGGLLNQLVDIPGLGKIPLSQVLVGGQLLSSGLGALGSISAANTLAGAANQATGLQNQIYGQTQSNLAPYRGAGTAALGALTSYLNDSPTGGPGGGPGLLHPFGASDLNANLAPNYNWQLGQGMGQLQNQAAASGGALGGNTLSGLNSFAQNYAQNAYQNAFQNYTTNQNNIYSRLGSLAQLGQQSATAGASGAPLFAAGMSNTITGAGSALAGGTVGATNAASSGISNLLGYYTLNSLMNQQPSAVS